MDGREIVDEFIDQGRLNKVILRKMVVPAEIRSQLDEGAELEPNQAYIEYAIIAKRGEGLPMLGRIKRAVNNEVSVNELFTIRNFEYDHLAVNITLNGHTRTMDISALAKVGAFFDITDEVIINTQTGHPTLESLRLAIDVLQNELHETINPIAAVNE